MTNKWEKTALAAWDAILKKVKALKREGRTLQEIADLMGVGNRALVGEWINGNREAVNTSFSNLMNYLERLGYSYLDFFPREPPSIRRVATNAPTEKVSGTDLKTINVYSVAGAGPGVDVSEIEPLFQVTAPPDYFRRSDYALVVDGHSMEPLIAHGSIVGIKLHAPFVANELYVARIPYEGLVIKRVGVDLAANEFIFKSENPNKENYPDFRLNINEAEGIIIGRVVWVMWGY